MAQYKMYFLGSLIKVSLKRYWHGIIPVDKEEIQKRTKRIKQ